MRAWSGKKVGNSGANSESRSEDESMSVRYPRQGSPYNSHFALGGRALRPHRPTGREPVEAAPAPKNPATPLVLERQ